MEGTVGKDSCRVDVFVGERVLCHVVTLEQGIRLEPIMRWLIAPTDEFLGV